MALLKKMSMKTLLDATPKNTIRDMIASGAIVFGDVAVRIVGVVDGTKTGETTYGEYVAFTGDFMASVAKTGEQFESGVLFLDKGTTEQVAQRLAAARETDANASVEIAVEVAIVKDTKEDSKGYMYVTRPLQSEQVASRRQALLAKLNSANLLTSEPAPAEKPKK